jgi:crotonobetainyl-CoA:carnitine CoA-transferase CaiB-like acyl-CoA transferase
MLSPYRVLDLTDGGAALCGQILADLGADVVLVEPPGGVGSRRRAPFYKDEAGPERSLHFWATHRNKRSLVLDLESAGGRAELLAQSDWADVLVEDRPPGWLAERGLGPERLRERNPGLVVVSITPFGQRGPKARWAATDVVVCAASGQLWLCGDEDRPPLTSSAPQGFLNAGAEAAVGALLALVARERDGLGQHVDVSAQTAMMMTTQSLVLARGWNDQELSRFGGGLRLGPLRLRFVYPCKDGYVSFTFLFGPAIGPATARMFRWMHEEGYADDALRDKDWDNFAGHVLAGKEPLSELERATAAIEYFTRAHTKAELFRGAFERRVLIVPMSDIGDLFAFDQLAAREFWTRVPHPELGASVRYPGPMVKLSETPIRYRRRPPLCGEHDAELRGESRPPRAAATPKRVDSRRPPLAGQKVLDLSWVYAGPAITRYLADHGASVVRVESQSKIDALRVGQPFKDGVPGFERSGNYSNANVGKLGLGLNLSIPAAREVVLRLVDWADVVVENFSPRAMKAWGMDYPALRARKPELIMLSSCLCGQTGPRSALAGYGTMGAALAGFGFLTGWPDRPPVGPFLAYTDYLSPRFATAALLAALDHRRRTGRGQYIDCSQAESCIHLLGVAALDYEANGRVLHARGNARPDYAPSGVYPCAGQDRWIALAAPDDASFRALAGTLDPHWLSDARFATVDARRAHTPALDAAIASRTPRHAVEELERALQAAGVPAHRVANSADCFGDPQLLAREHFVWLDHPECGNVPLESSRMRLSRTPATAAWPGPTLGQHNELVLRNFAGMGDEEIAELVASGALE